MYHHASHPMGISKVASFVVVPPPVYRWVSATSQRDCHLGKIWELECVSVVWASSSRKFFNFCSQVLAPRPSR